MNRVAYPFLRIPEDAVEFSGWFIGDPGAPLLPASDVLADWDYARDLTVRANLNIDWPAASLALGFGDESWSAMAQLVIGTGQGHLPRQIRYATQQHLSNLSHTANLEFVIPASSLSAQLVARIEILLIAPSASASPLSPRMKGARLWTQELDVLIEDGGSSRFPVSSISFKAAFADKPHEFAPWYVQWRPEDIAGDFSSKVVLYVNSDEKEFLEKFLQGERATIQSVLGGVASHICSTILLRKDEDLDLDVFEDGSVGAVVRHWLQQAFPNEGGTSGIVKLLENDPGAFHASLIASADVGEQNA